MDILLLAPHPFYQERGSPIAVNQILRALSERGDRIDLVTYHEGHDMPHANLTLHRVPRIPLVRNIRPGFSWKKVVSDLFMLALTLSLVLRKRYHLIHAVEESVFIALLLKWLFKIPYVYDMDSSLAQQMVERYPLLRHCAFLLRFFEGIAVRHAKAVIPVCQALAHDIARYQPAKVVVLQDVSLLKNGWTHQPEDLRARLAIDGHIVMYVGNLESYQGIDLLLESFALTLQRADRADLVVIGGAADDIRRYQEKAQRLGVDRRVHFLGPRPIEHLSAYLAQADILVSPRIQGANTPMKIYSYLDSGKALLATDLPTHTQILNRRVAALAPPIPEAFAAELNHLLADDARRASLSAAARAMAAGRFTYEAFRDQVHELFQWLQEEIAQEAQPLHPPATHPRKGLSG